MSPIITKLCPHTGEYAGYHPRRRRAAGCRHPEISGGFGSAPVTGLTRSFRIGQFENNLSIISSVCLELQLLSTRMRMNFLRTYGVLLAAILTTNACGQSFACKQKTFNVKVNGGESFRHGIGAGLELVLDPYKDHGGWSLRVSPVGSDVDWSYPVNLPLDGEAQALGSGWGATAMERLSGTKSLSFVLNALDFGRYSKLADDALHSSAPSAAGDFIGLLKKGIFGSVALSHFQLETDGSPNSIKWVTFIARITVPESFEDQAGWRPSRCDTER